MHFTKFLSTIALLPAVLALPTPEATTAELTPKTEVEVRVRDSCATTCGSVCYYQSDIDEAVSTGYNDYQSGSSPGGYPHTYNNYEGFDFPVSGPYQEFPILSSYQAYTGGSPGADRVVFNTQGQYAGSITHTGASGNDFVGCSGTS